MADVFLTLGGGLNTAALMLSPLLLLPLFTLVLPKVFAPVARPLSCGIDWVSGALLNTAIVCSLILLFSQLAIVIARFMFGLAWSSLNETVTYSFAAMFLLAAAGALRDDAHVRVDILRPRFGHRINSIITIFGVYLFIFPVCILILYMGQRGITNTWRIFEGSRETDGLPIYFLFKTLVPFFAVTFLFAGLSEAVKEALKLRGKVEAT